MAHIHPTAVIDSGAQLDPTVRVGPFCVIGPHVRIGPGTTLGSHCVIENHTTIGADNRISHHVCLGQRPQDLKFRGEPATLEIGDHNDIREAVTMHIGTANGGGRTTVGSYNLIMVGAHVAHDCHVRNRCIIANNVMLAGHIVVEDHAVISGGAAITHYVTIGRYVFIGGLAGVVRDCPPFMSLDGHPARVHTVNKIGLMRHGFAAEAVERLKDACRALFNRRANNQAAALDELEARFADDAHVMDLCRFVRRSAAAPNGRHLETLRVDDKRAVPAG